MKIAVIGSGISGLSAAHFLSQQHDVSVFEANDYIGGHTATVDIELAGQSYAVDTGFIVFNDWNYPEFMAFIQHLGLTIKKTEMGFSVNDPKRSFEYCGNDLNTLFAQRSNLAKPAFYRLLIDIIRFNRRAKHDYENNLIPKEMTLAEYLSLKRYSDLFTTHYLLPMAAAIWSATTQQVNNFEALFFIRFFYNHGLLNINNRPQWYVLEGGSRSYIEPIIAPFKSRIFLSSPVSNITRHENSVSITVKGQTQQFDHIILACHSDQALSILKDPSDMEQELLSAIPYSENRVTLHTDKRLLPKRQKAWASWNYRIDDNQSLPLLTYNMNILQGIDAPETLCVTLNDTDNINPEKILREFTYAHPQFSKSSVAAQQQWQTINGQNRTWFCGAYWQNGFHEDGFVSGKRVAQWINGVSDNE